MRSPWCRGWSKKQALRRKPPLGGSGAGPPPQRSSAVSSYKCCSRGAHFGRSKTHSHSLFSHSGTRGGGGLCFHLLLPPPILLTCSCFLKILLFKRVSCLRVAALGRNSSVLPLPLFPPIHFNLLCRALAQGIVGKKQLLHRGGCTADSGSDQLLPTKTSPFSKSKQQK